MSTQASPAAAPRTPSLERSVPGRLFYAGVQAVLLVFVVWGFHHFYLQGRQYPGRPLTPPIRGLIITHGTGMALWMLLGLAQPLLIFSGKRRVHMTLGKIGAALAAVIVIAGFKLGIDATRLTPPEVVIWTLTPKQFLTVPIFSILMFAGLVTAGVVYRRKPESHRNLMLLATLAALPAAVSRIDALSKLYMGTALETIFGPWFWTLVLAGAICGAKWALTRKLDRVLAIGSAGLALSSVVIMILAKTALWDGIAGFLLG